MNSHADVSSRARDRYFGLCLHLHPYFVYASGEGSDKSVFTVALPECRKKYTHQRETTGSSSDSLQLRPFSKWELEKDVPRGSEYFPLRTVAYDMENHFTTSDDLP